MNEKKLYLVRAVYEEVVVAPSETTACLTLYQALQGDHPPDACEETATPITRLDQLPEGWSGNSIPYGEDAERKVIDWLTTTKRLSVRGDPKQVATFLASMRGVAERMRVEIVDVPDAAPETTEAEAPCES